jgi:hypothetical protein
MARRPTPRAKAACESMHTGAPCRPARAPLPAARPRELIALREMTRVDGTQRMGPGRLRGPGRVHYFHEFDPGAGPTIAVDPSLPKNNMVLVGGNYRVTSEGMIEDLTMKHYSRRHRNPESPLAFLLLAGLALGLVTVVLDVLQAMLPDSWSVNSRKAMIAGYAFDALAIVGGAMLAKKSPVWAIALVGAGVSDGVSNIYVQTGLREKVRGLFHRAPAPPPSPAPGGSSGLPEGRTRRDWTRANDTIGVHATG